MYLLVDILQHVDEISSFSEVLYKRDVLENFLNFTDKLKSQSSGSALSKDVLRNFEKFKEKHLCRNSFFHKVADWKPESFRSMFTKLEMFSKIRCS